MLEHSRIITKPNLTEFNKEINMAESSEDQDFEGEGIKFEPTADGGEDCLDADCYEEVKMGVADETMQQMLGKHSSGDLHSRLKTRKLLGVGETDDGDVHRSKLSQILGHSDQLYIRLPSGLRMWQFIMAVLFSVMAVWALLFPSHYYSTMFETDGQNMSLPIRLYATALICIAVMYWSTVQAADRDVIRLVLLSSVVFFTLQTIVTGISMVPDTPSRRKIMLLVGRVLCSAVGYYFYVITGCRPSNLHRTTSNKELNEKDQ